MVVPPPAKKRFSVIIATYNRPETLRHCLETLMAQEFPPAEFEIVVVDDGSERSYKPLQETFPSVVWLRQANAGPALARNTGPNKPAVSSWPSSMMTARRTPTGSDN